jgi:hypothetical protein
MIPNLSNYTLITNDTQVGIRNLRKIYINFVKRKISRLIKQALQLGEPVFFSGLQVEHLAQPGEYHSETEHSETAEEPSADGLGQISARHRDEQTTSFRDQ